MKNVMTRAWEIAREAVKNFGGKVKEFFSQSLKMAWEEIKGEVKMVELKGSEKQVKWATDIRAKMISCIASYENLTGCERVAECVSIVKSIKERVLTEENSAWFIENRDLINEQKRLNNSNELVDVIYLNYEHELISFKARSAKKLTEALAATLN